MILLLPAFDQQYICLITIPPDITLLLGDIQNNDIEIATDGSVCNPQGSYAWIIHGRTSGVQLYGINLTGPTATSLTSFYTECCGSLGATLALRALLIHFNLLTPPFPYKARAHIDNQDLFSHLTLQHTHSIHHTFRSNCDLIYQLLES